MVPQRGGDLGALNGLHGFRFPLIRRPSDLRFLFRLGQVTQAPPILDNNLFVEPINYCSSASNYFGFIPITHNTNMNNLCWLSSHCYSY